jgi:hypothetical protein
MIKKGAKEILSIGGQFQFDDPKEINQIVKNNQKVPNLKIGEEQIDILKNLIEKIISEKTNEIKEKENSKEITEKELLQNKLEEDLNNEY